MSGEIKDNTSTQSPDRNPNGDDSIEDISSDITRPTSSSSNTLDIPSTVQEEDEINDDDR